MLKGSHAYRIPRAGLQITSKGRTRPSNHTTQSFVSVSSLSTPRNRAKSSRPGADHESENQRSRSKVIHGEAIDTWITGLDPYLPLELRSRTWQDNLTSFEGVRSVESLPKLLADSDAVFSTGILTHIALVQRRWDAVLCICQAIARFDKKPAKQPINLLKGSPWSTLQAAGPPVDVNLLEKHAQLWDIRLFKEPINSLQDELSLDFITQTPFLRQDTGANRWERLFGQVWRCLGHVMLAATREQSPSQVDMIGFVLQVIAAMHSHGIVSEAIYLFEANEVPTTSRKPPFLHLMSSRIMTSVSDIVWKKVEPDLIRDVAYVVAKHAHEGEITSAGDFSPRLRPLKNEVWLEFILWSCIHGSHFQEGLEIINSMNMGDEHQRWSTVPWYVLQETLDAKLLEQRDIRNARSWYERLASSLEGYSEEAPLLDLGRNTISSEVVTRLCDGILSASAFPVDKSWSPTKSIANCMDLLGPVSTPIDYNTRQSLLYRLASDDINYVLDLANDDPSDFERRWKYMTDNIVHGKAPSLAFQVEADPLHSILVTAMAHHVERSNINAALRSYEQLKIWSGNASQRLELPDNHDPSLISTPLLSQVMDIKFLLPSSIWASFLDLLLESKMLKTGRAILASLQSRKLKTTSNSIHQRSSAIHDATIQHAGPTLSNNDLRMWGDKAIAGRFSNEKAFRESLHTQIMQNNWLLTREILISMTSKNKIPILTDDIARIASRIMRLRIKENTEDSVRLQEILTEILDGQYRTPQVPGQTPDWSEARRLNQICRLLQSLPDHHFSDLGRYAIESGQASNPVTLPTTALNILLEAIIESFGMEAGKNFAQIWCLRQVGKAERRRLRARDGRFPCFNPNLLSLRTMIQPFTSRFRKFYRDPQLVIRAHESGDSSSVRNGEHKGNDGADNKVPLAASYESLIKRYYDEYGGAEYLPTVSWVMNLCKEYKQDEENTFYTLFQPMEEMEEDMADGIHPINSDRQSKHMGNEDGSVDI